MLKIEFDNLISNEVNESRNWNIVIDSNQISQTKKLIQDTWINKGELYNDIKLGIKHSSRAFDVYYINELDAWCSFTTSPLNKPTRYMNAFGLGNPLDSKSIMCEINFNFNGKLGTAGLIAKNSREEKFILHSGRLGGKYNSKIFWDDYIGDELSINGKRYAIISKVDSPQLLDNIINFVKKVAYIKENSK